MAKRKKQSSKVHKKAAKARPKAKKSSKAARGKAATKRTVARAKSKRAKRMKQPTALAVETVAIEVVEQPAPGVITVTEVEETELRKVS